MDMQELNWEKAPEKTLWFVDIYDPEGQLLDRFAMDFQSRNEYIQVDFDLGGFYYDSKVTKYDCCLCPLIAAMQIIKRYDLFRGDINRVAKHESGANKILINPYCDVSLDSPEAVLGLG